MSEKVYFDADAAYDSGTLHNWYIDSVSGEDVPVWTDEHIDELMNDFYVIPKDTKPANVVTETYAHWKCADDIDENVWICSKCGLTWFLEAGTPSMNEMRYCPKCGAYMIESEGE